MKWYRNLSIRSKITTLMGVVVLILVVLLSNTYRDLASIRDNQRLIAERYFKANVDIQRIKNEINESRVHVLSAALGRQLVQNDRLEATLDARFVQISAEIDGLLNSVQDQPELKSELALLSVYLRRYQSNLSQQLSLILAGKEADAVTLELSNQAPLQDSIKSVSARLSVSLDNLLDARIRSGEADVSSTVVFFLMLGLLGFGVIFLIILQTNKYISNPLVTLTGIAGEIARGNTTATVPDLGTKDEVGALYQSFSRVQQFLNEVSQFANRMAQGDLSGSLTPKSDQDLIVKSLNTMLEQLRGILGNTSKSIDVLTNSGNTIFTAVSALSTGSNQTASAIGETSTSIEEVKRTAEISARKAREISASAQKAFEVSEGGIRSTEESIEGNNRIGSQMNQISGNIRKLMDQSKTIGEVISLVNELAEQSNILAVNAAIEAARAGEQGKTFVVVAQEMRSLAEQSKQATGQVKSALQDIQLAVSATANAVEQGERIVQSGIVLAKESREAIQKLVETISSFTDLALQMSVSGQEQFIGMDQISLAMDNIKVASMQNARSTKDLELSAAELKGLADRLKSTITIFRLQ